MYQANIVLKCEDLQLERVHLHLYLYLDLFDQLNDLVRLETEPGWNNLKLLI